MKTRTIREFTITADIWPIVDRWADESGFTLAQQEKSLRVYTKGRWLFMAPTHLEISQKGHRVLLQVWLKAEFFMIRALMTGKPTEAGLESGGLSAWMQRKKARIAVNRLLLIFGQQPIS